MTISKQVIHESGSKCRHRLVLIGEGVHEKSPWFEFHEIGQFKGYFFNQGVEGSPLPVGVFRVTTVEAQTF